VALACSLNRLSLLQLDRILPNFFMAAAEGACEKHDRRSRQKKKRWQIKMPMR
jgi:hypothetical protein